MTQSLTERPALRGRWPWSRRTSRLSDITAAVVLFLCEIPVIVWKVFGDGMAVWAAQGEQDRIDAANLASIAWNQQFLYVALALVGLAAVSRAPWTVVSQLLVAGLLGAMLANAQHVYDVEHPAPAPTPTVLYTPCLSGSGTCH
ncbi:DUF6234 family protein [Streptomyces sp. NBC_01478]|uniref:DUF6234 family protein n=1 Tax=Streptomyces sp. NBC_01478 TaxID=2903882 RepID=UPI002E2FF6E5|nr:DUF6234 family protein [Streptomyces sp. NBC_01478]